MMDDYIKRILDKIEEIGGNGMKEYIERDNIHYTQIETGGYCGNTWVTDYEMVARKKDIDSIPAADVRENVRGEWIHWARSDECSVCGYNTGKYEMGSKFCPSCGADMRGEKDV